MCKYCEGKSDISDKTYSDGSTYSDCVCRVVIEKTLYGNALVVTPVEYKNGEKQKMFSHVFSINYCPKCGRKLGE